MYMSAGGQRGSAYKLGLVLGVEKLLAEDLPVRLGGGLLNYDLGAIIRQLEDDELELVLLGLEVVVGGYAVPADGRSGGRNILAT
jgi:hypothetical protein